MKIGICAGVNEVLQLKPGSADYVELNLSEIQKMSASELKNIQEQLRLAGQKAEASNCFFPANLKLCGSSYRKQSVSEYCKKAVFNASLLGIHTCVLGSGKARNIDDSDDRTECLKQIEEAFFVAGEIAKEFDTTIVLEPLNKKETNVINTVAEGAAFCRKLNHSNIRLLADIYHVAVENEPFDVISQNGNLLKHVHIARPEGRLFPTEHDGFDYLSVKSILDKAGYDLRISIEGASPGNFVECAQASLSYLKSIFQ